MMFWLVGFFITLPLIGILYQIISTKLDQKKYLPPGFIVDIGGYCIHLNCEGLESPTVLLDAGMRSNSLEWSLVQPKIAEFARVCSFDRAGTGWSERSPLERTSFNIVTELYSALQKANIMGPYIVVGHSFGGLNMHLFAKMYPEEVVGVILVDSASENYDKLLKPNFNLTWMKLSTLFGLSRLLSYFPNARKSLKSFPKLIQDEYLSFDVTTQSMNTAIEEFLLFDQSAQQLRQIGSQLEDIPLTIITARVREFWEGVGFTHEESSKMFNEFETLQTELLSRSNHSKQIFANNSDHMIPRTEPQIIVDAVYEQVQAFQKDNKISTQENGDF